MASKIWQYLRKNWKYNVCTLTPLAVVAIIFSFPLKTISVQVEESYWDTELQKHAYTVTESYEILEPSITQQVRSETLYDSNVSGTNVSYTFKVTNPDTTVDIRWQSFYPSYPIVLRWYDCDSSEPIPHYYFLSYRYWTGARLTVKLTYPETITTYNMVTKFREVTRYIDVPTPVLKTRTVTEYRKISIWSYLFR